MPAQDASSALWVTLGLVGSVVISVLIWMALIALLGWSVVAVVLVVLVTILFLIAVHPTQR